MTSAPFHSIAVAATRLFQMMALGASDLFGSIIANWSSLLYGVVVPSVVVIVMLMGIDALRRRLKPETLQKAPNAFRWLRRPVGFTIAAYFSVLIVGPGLAWHWFSAPIEMAHHDLALVVPAIAITAWSGCLIAFAVRQRLTPELSRGLRFLIYACGTPLIALTGSGIALRGSAIAVAALAAFWTSIQIGRLRRKKKMKIDFKVAPVLEPGAPPPSASAEAAARYLEYFFRDRAAEILHGWPWSAILFGLAVALIINSTEAVVIGCSLVAALGGITLAFVALILPDTGDASLVV